VQVRDFVAIGRKVAGGRFADVWGKVHSDSTRRALDVWDEIHRPPAHWLSIPAVQRRWGRMVTGDGSLRFVDHVADTYLAGQTGLRALSIGCGSAAGELEWAATGRFERIDAFDLAPEPVEEARRQAEVLGLAGVLHVSVSDIADFAMPPDSYDVVLVEHALHHMAPMDTVLERIRRTLRPGGIFCLDEYVGPTRFQWTPRQLEAADALLKTIPERLRTAPDGVRRSVVRPSLARMVLTDPSEAIRSAEIVPGVRDRFEVVEERGYGGTLLHLVLADISQHFLDDADHESMQVLNALIAVEDALLHAGEIDHDFATMIARRTR